MIHKVFTNFCLFFFYISLVCAQVPEVPSVIYFADMTLKLNDRARREIQADVNALYRSSSYFKVKMDRVNLYMPIIERVLREEGVPADFKYLVIQESSLIPDAVSTSNAVGFWQFKEATAKEVFLRVDRQIDERKSIVSATRGAAHYLKKHQMSLDNWAIALVSYQMGLGGARRYYKDQYKGKNTMHIDKNSYWYLKKFLAHKVAFEGKVGRLVSNNNQYLHEYPVMGPTSLSKVAKKLGVSENHLQEYNKWTSNGKIPGDRTYVVTYILKGIEPDRPVLAQNTPASPQTGLSSPYENAVGFPKISGNLQLAHLPNEIKINGIKGILASHGSSQEEFSQLANISKWKLRRANDLKRSDPIQAGCYYYTKRKKSTAMVEEHVVQPRETLWEISQQFGIRLSSLKAKNRVYKDNQLRAGMVLKLRKYYKKNEPMGMARIITKAQNQKAPVATPSSQTINPVPPIKSYPKDNSQVQKPEMDSPNVILHQVIPGDTLYAISKKYEVTVKEIKLWNQLGEGNLLSVGQNLTIRK